MSPFETERRALREFWLDEGRLVAVEWADGLPAHVERCARRFRLEVGDPLPGGSLALVLAATTRTGTPVVMKLNPPLPELEPEPDALAAIGGRGAVRILDTDPELAAFVLERARPGHSLERSLSLPAALAIAAGIAARTHAELPTEHSFPTVDGYLARLVLELPLRHVFAARALPPRVLELTLDACGRLVEPAGPIGLVNEDLHLGNILSARREPWLLIDPKPYAGEVAFSAGYLVRSACDGVDDAALAEGVTIVAEGMGTTWQRVRDWALVRTATGVYERGTGADPGSDLELASALSRL